MNKESQRKKLDDSKKASRIQTKKRTEGERKIR